MALKTILLQLVWCWASKMPRLTGLHGIESRCWRQLRDDLYVAGTCFTRTFPQLRSSPPSCQPREKWCTLQKQTWGEVIFDLPRHPPRKVRDMTTSNNSPPLGLNGWNCPSGCPRGSNNSNWTVHQWHVRKSEASFPWLVQNCVPPFSCYFRFLLKFSALTKFTTTGAGYGPLPRANRYAI